MKRFLPLSLLLFAGGSATAQPTAPADSINFVEFFLVSLAVVLVFVIWGLSSVLMAYARKTAENNKKESVGTTAAMLVTLLGLALPGFAQETTVVAAASAANYGGMSPTTFYLLLGVIGAELLVIFFLLFTIQRLTSELYPKVAPAPAATPQVAKETWLWRTWRNLDRRFFTKPAEKEADVLLDHDYDGIHELDNALPPWWKYGFYVTIVLAVMYLLRFHVFESGPSPEQEYAAEMKRADEQIKAYMAKAKDMVDENTVQFDATGIAVGKELYLKTCVACHGQQGEGGVGPNLTDAYWIHGGSMGDIFKTIKYGFPDKGMQSWQQQFSPKQMAQLSSYIKTLKGTNPPNSKAPQGDLYEENETPAADSAGVTATAALGGN